MEILSVRSIFWLSRVLIMIMCVNVSYRYLLFWHRAPYNNPFFLIIPAIFGFSIGLEEVFITTYFYERSTAASLYVTLAKMLGNTAVILSCALALTCAWKFMGLSNRRIALEFLARLLLACVFLFLDPLI